MPFTDIDLLPVAPQRNDAPDEFAEKADAFVAAMQTFSEQQNTFIAELETFAALLGVDMYADPALVALTGNTPAADRVPYYTGSGTSALATFTAFARSLLAGADAAAMRGTLGLGTAATQNTTAFDAAGTGAAAAASAVSTHVAAGDPHTQYLLESAVGSAFNGALSFNSNANGHWLAIPVGARTYYLQTGIRAAGSNGWSSSYDLPVALGTEGWIIACSTEINASGTDSDKVAAKLVSTSQFQIGHNDSAAVQCTWFVLGY